MSDRSRRYRLSPLAEADLEEIWLYTFKHWSLEQADIYHNLLVAAFEELAAGTKIRRRVDIRSSTLSERILCTTADRTLLWISFVSCTSE
ncbi:type II toxin-antitoxin system RelE/ParE family toxin [Chelativorans sp.]|uniref:type II toxin-antitoxin system RelE/ParE family toxin n=1 Tax=Chelativorans sp. TaxID=2203393 RepID=UPI0028119957|nr:type II toxin-antitoxin system RelE/ParE family toxin [Chelativorans sp.]